MSVNTRVVPPTAASAEITRSDRRSIPSPPVAVQLDVVSGSESVAGPSAGTVTVRENGTV